MAFQKLETSLNIIQALDDTPIELPEHDSAWLKAQFDAAGNIIKTFINAFIDTINGAAGASNIGIDAADAGLDATTIQAALKELKDGLAQAIDEHAIPDDSVSTDKLQNLAVNSNKLGSLAVTEEKIYGGAVTAAKLAADAVETAKIKDGNVTTEKLAAAAVTHEKLGQNAVEAGNIKNGAVTEDKIAANAVTFGKIANGAVGNAKLAAYAVTNSKTDFSSGLFVGDLKFYGTCFGDSLPGSGTEGRIFFVKV